MFNPLTKSISSAVIKIGKDMYEGTSHAEAIQKAINAGQDVSKVYRWRDGQFKTSDGRIIDRSKAQEEFGFNRSEDIPTQWDMPSWPSTPTPHPAHN